MMGYGYVLSTVSPERFKESEEAAKQYVDTKGRLKGDYDGAAGKNKAIREEAAKLVEPLAGRENWIELYKAINESLPRDLGDAVAEQDVQKRNRIRIYSITAERLSDASTWFSALGEREKTSMLKADVDKAPSGVAYLFTLYGRHFYNDPNNFNMQGTLYVTNTMMRALQSWRVREGLPLDPLQLAAFQRDRDAFALQAPPGTALPPFPGVPVRQLGLTHAVFRQSWSKDVWYSPKGRKGLTGLGAGGAGGLPTAEGGLPAVRPGIGRRPIKPGAPGAPAVDPATMMADPGDGPIKIKQTDFAIQFLWKETPAKDRPATDPDVQVTLPTTDPAAGGASVDGAVPAVPGGVPGDAAIPQPPAGVMPAAPGIAPPGVVPPGFVPPAVPPAGAPPQ
jgi:type IV pilus assembly protein PilM